MNWALRKVLGNTITQKGSYVGPDRLRFDFSHGAAMTPDEIAEVEKLVNEKIAADVPVKWEERPYAEVKGDPCILQFFGDKYGDVVRVVSIGDFSKELCGGTHVRHSAQVGYFKILHEAAIAAGIRRIEAASGDALRATSRRTCPQAGRAFAAVAVDLRAAVGSVRRGRHRRPEIGGYPDYTSLLGTTTRTARNFSTTSPPNAPSTKRKRPSTRKPRSRKRRRRAARAHRRPPTTIDEIPFIVAPGRLRSPPLICRSSPTRSRRTGRASPSSPRSRRARSRCSPPWRRRYTKKIQAGKNHPGHRAAGRRKGRRSPRTRAGRRDESRRRGRGAREGGGVDTRSFLM